jgi:hypothetical protein
MSDNFENSPLIKPWPTITDDWMEVHSRFGIAAQAGCELETGLLMLLSQAQQIRGRAFGIDQLIVKLETNGELSMGRLVSALNEENPLPKELLDSLQAATKKRNFLIHHFYRHHAAGFSTSDGCRALADKLVGIYDEFEQVTGKLKTWSDATLGTVPPDVIRDHASEELDSWKSTQQKLYQAILGKKHAI